MRTNPNEYRSTHRCCLWKALGLSLVLVAALAPSAGAQAPQNAAVPGQGDPSALPAFENASFSRDPSNPNRLAVAYTQGRAAETGVSGPWPSKVCGLALSQDGGATWTAQVIAAPKTPADPQNPAAPRPPLFGARFSFPEGYDRCGLWHRPFASRPVVAFGPDGALYYVYMPSGRGSGGAGSDRLFIIRSSDGGATFTDPKLVDPLVPAADGDHFYSIAVDQTTGPRGRVHVTWNRSKSGENKILTAFSDDGGATFSAPKRLTPSTQVYPEGGTRTAVGSDGRVYVSWFDKTIWYPSFGLRPGTLYVASSRDQGATFSSPVAVGTTGGGMCGLLTCELHYDTLIDVHALAAGPAPSQVPGGPGQVVLGWYDRLVDGRYRVFAAVSTDGGANWAPSLLSPKFFGVPAGGEGNDQHRPGVSVAPNGRIDIAYYDLAPDAQQNVYSISSCDRGQSFSAPTKLTTAASDAKIGPPSSGARISLVGEVYVASSTSQLAAAWTDTRNGTTQSKRQDVFFGSLEGRSSCAGGPPGPDTGQPPPPPPPGGGGGAPGPDPGGGGGSGSSPGGGGSGPRPGAAAARCGDLTRPRSSVSKRSRLTRTRVLFTGRTTDRECTPDGRIVRTERKLSRVEISVATREGKQCRFLTAKGTLSSARSCARPVWLRAKTVSFDAKKAKTSWRLARAVRLPAGRYTVIVRGVDRDGNVEVKKRRSNRATLRAR